MLTGNGKGRVIGTMPKMDLKKRMRCGIEQHVAGMRRVGKRERLVAKQVDIVFPGDNCRCIDTQQHGTFGRKQGQYFGESNRAGSKD